MQRIGEGRQAWIVLDGEVLSANHAVSLEPLAAKLLGGTVGGVGPLDACIQPYLLSVGEGITGNGDEGVLLRVEHTGCGVHTESLHICGLESPSNTASGRVGHLKRIRGIEDDLGAGLGGDISGRNGLGHVDEELTDTQCLSSTHTNRLLLNQGLIGFASDTQCLSSTHTNRLLLNKGLSGFASDTQCLSSTHTNRLLLNQGLSGFASDTQCLSSTHTNRLLLNQGLIGFASDTQCLSSTHTNRLLLNKGLSGFARMTKDEEKKNVENTPSAPT
ncbi:hypothetical protein PRIPAC_85946 [Pristionchus pacificus]|uniref:Uncharacterized protein n=1 Tax=Pristionchus pacificus TaxID=54126 RepID=A0A2A6BUA5_PRIPA|nr:hypothetical protein PRIPAC_85946 [Pristionchus pacificus]|eukprot:PDM69393.1 hypothetical protein PRIPAC_47695 [Pristionchus pacificus]